MLPEATLDQARVLLAQMDAKRMTLATAESCTGGLIAAALTAIAGSSSVVMAGFVTYANDAKQKMVGVRTETLAAQGAVSEDVAREMAEGARARAGEAKGRPAIDGLIERMGPAIEVARGRMVHSKG